MLIVNQKYLGYFPNGATYIATYHKGKIPKKIDIANLRICVEEPNGNRHLIYLVEKGLSNKEINVIGLSECKELIKDAHYKLINYNYYSLRVDIKDLEDLLKDFRANLTTVRDYPNRWYKPIQYVPGYDYTFQLNGVNY